MAANKLELVIEVETKGANASIKRVNSSLSSMEAVALKTARGASSGIDSLTVSIAKGAAAANVLPHAFERMVGWLKEQIVETSRLAARNETLAVVNAQLARANGYSEGSIGRLVGRVKELGITTQASRDIVNKTIAPQPDLSEATELTRLARDAAVVAGQDSSQALQGIIDVITTQQIEVLRTYGINIQFERASSRLTTSRSSKAGTSVMSLIPEVVHGITKPPSRKSFVYGEIGYKRLILRPWHGSVPGVQPGHSRAALTRLAQAGRQRLTRQTALRAVGAGDAPGTQIHLSIQSKASSCIWGVNECGTS